MWAECVNNQHWINYAKYKYRIWHKMEWNYLPWEERFWATSLDKASVQIIWFIGGPKLDSFANRGMGKEGGWGNIYKYLWQNWTNDKIETEYNNKQSKTLTVGYNIPIRNGNQRIGAARFIHWWCYIELQYWSRNGVKEWEWMWSERAKNEDWYTHM